MKEMSLKEVQGVLLEMMVDVHSFCVKNNIQYTLAYGSLLGAIRHKGFIPWDDDMDIMMTRPNYERFISLYRSEKYLLMTPLNKKCYMGYARLYDIHRTYAKENKRSLRQSAGVWIDILPVDGVSESESERSLEYMQLCKIREMTHGVRNNIYDYRTGSLSSRIRGGAKLIAKNIIRGSQHSLFEKYETLCKRHSFGTTSLCSNYYCYSAYLKRKIELMKTDWFDSYVIVDFEGKELFATSDYDAVLKSIFGDYMVLPPENKRGGFHSASFYWKDKK